MYTDNCKQPRPVKCEEIQEDIPTAISSIRTIEEQIGYMNGKLTHIEERLGIDLKPNLVYAQEDTITIHLDTIVSNLGVLVTRLEHIETNL